MIVAVDHSGGYANGRDIPWSFKADWTHFKKITKGNICIMGRGTYDDIAGRRKEKSPNFEVILPGRTSYVISETRSKVQGATVFPSVGQCISSLPTDDREIFILGGRRLWVQYLPKAKQIWMTIVPGQYKTNKKFPIELLTDYEITEGYKEPVGDDELMFVKYVRKVDYYSVQFPMGQHGQQLAEQLKRSHRLIKEEPQISKVTFIEPFQSELKFIKQVGGQLTIRKGLAIE